MMEIYTPKEWSRFFGGAPSLYIKDDGYIYTREEEVKLMGRPCGRIDYGKGRVYGSDYASVNPDPVGYLQSKDGVTEVYVQYPGWNVKPILVIKGNEIYTYSEYTRIMGGTPSGYIKSDDDKGGGGRSSGSGSSSGNGTPAGGSSSSGGYSGGRSSSGGGFLGDVGAFAVIIGIFLLLMFVDEIRQQGAKYWISVAVIFGILTFFRHRIRRRKQEKSAPERKADPAPKPKHSPKPTPKTDQKPVTKATPKTGQKPATKPAPKTKPQPAEDKIASCPHCGAKFRSPVGVGTIKITCPNPDCKKQFTLDT